MIKYDPKKLLKQIAPESKIKKLLNSNAGVNKTALSFVNDIDFVSKKNITKTALKTAKEYKARIKKDPDALKAIKKDPTLMINRVQNSLVYEIAKSIKENYSGKKYVWTPSDAEEPDPVHQLKYGKTFTIGVGEMPGDRYGCRCGMDIITEETKLDL